MSDLPLYDITPRLTLNTKVWPGDTPPSREVLCDMARGDNITLSTLRSTVHLGAHADGPNHYVHPAPGIGERGLHSYLGPCHVIDAPTPRNSRISAATLRAGLQAIRHPRILLRTGTFPSHDDWNDDFAGIEPALIDALAARGVITIGIDTPSVDLMTSKDLPAHKAVARHDMAILEGLDLSAVPIGPEGIATFELIALPLRLIGFDASPVRAVLRALV